MPSTSSNGGGPRYAPDDPTLPEPWRGLVDGSTGYLYYWNPVTNVTQYEKPAKERLPGPPPLPPPPPKPASMSVSSSIHRDSAEEDGRVRRDQHQGGRLSSSHSGHHSGDNGHVSSSAHGHGHGPHNSRMSTRGHGSSDAGSGLSTEAYRRHHEITVTGDDVPPPYTTFESTGFPSEILKEVHRAGFSAPTPIQAQSWPIALQSRDVVAIAKTGSGKTLGYLIPGFLHLKRLRNSPKLGPTVLVLAPTRELATQIQDEADKFGRSSKIASTCLYGGAPKGPQLRDLDRGVDVVVATPGRLNDILEMRRVSLRQVSYLVLDEADRMLDMGFEPQIRKIVKEVPHRRQTLMFTATWPKEVRKIAADLLVHPVQVNIGSIDELVANKAITQYVEVIKPIEKQRRLEQILRSQEPGSKVIIFCSTKRMCDQLSRTLTRQFGAAAIHGDKSQGERDRVLGQFRNGKSPILVATDVAARGLDIKDIRVVINYDFPTGVEDYVHRIGRTGRAGATGVSYTFFSDQDSKYAHDLVKVLEGASQRVPPELRDMVSRGGYGGKSRRWGSGSGGRDRGRGRDDSGYGGRGGRGLPLSLGRLDSDRGGLGRSDRETRDRYDRGYQDGEAGVRGRFDSKGITKGRDRSRSSSRSRSPSPKRARGGWGNSGSRSRSRSVDHRRSRSRSRSRSTSRGFNRYGGAGAVRGPSPMAKQRDPTPDHHARDYRSPTPHDHLQRRSVLPYDDGDIKRDDRSPSPGKDRSRLSYNSTDNGTREQSNGTREGSASPKQSQKRSPPHYSSPHRPKDDAERPPVKEPIRLPPLPCNGEEEEEGMIPAEEEEGMITS